MYDIEQNHYAQHQDAVKDVQEHFMRQYIPSIALHVLYHSKDRSNHDKDAGEVECMKVFSPWNIVGG